MKRSLLVACATASLALGAGALYPLGAQTTYHVSPSGSDSNDGTKAHPFKTISRAADAAQPGDVVTVHAGIYRERIAPPRGGTSETKRITYQSAPGEVADIRGSNEIKGWQRVLNDTWRVAIPNTVFGAFNPYKDVIFGDWFNDFGRMNHSGQVYIDGRGLIEASRFEHVLAPATDSALWYGYVTGDSTIIYAQFKGVDPNTNLAEINVRKTVFYPEKPGMNYITVRGFVMKHAASPWAPPTAEQIGLVGTHWSRGWIIENNTISYAKNVGVTLGKYGDEWDNRAESAEGYVGTINRAVQNGWRDHNIGHHIVRNNTITECGQAGVVGSLGAVFSQITHNEIHDINWHPLYSGAEVAGIKIHGAVDLLIANNHIHHAAMGIWLDWMAQGTHVTQNLLHDNREQDIMIEVDHGPYLLDNNIFLSPMFLFDLSEGGAVVHNLIAGRAFGPYGDSRKTPYFKPHSVEIVDLVAPTGGDMRFYNNVLLHHNALNLYKAAPPPVTMAGNMYITTVDSTADSLWNTRADGKPAFALTQRDGAYYLELFPESVPDTAKARQVITTALLGKAKVPQEGFENPDGTPLVVDRTYFGKVRKQRVPAAGPFETKSDTISIKVWPKE